MNYHLELHKLLLGIEFLSALIAFIYVFKLKGSYWKWFSVYLIFIFIQEFYWFFNGSLFGIIAKHEYYAFIGIPIQYLFFFWLYAYRSLNRKTLFFAFLIIYILTYIPVEFYFEKINLVYSINLTVGTTLLTFLVVLEFLKQIKNDNILNFKENKMFYVNVGVILFYIGTYPFFAFQDILTKDNYVNIWNIYYIYFLISNYAMYLLFAASFIWGKHHLR